MQTAVDARYRSSLLDWLACAYAGRDAPAPRAAAHGVLAAGAAGHVLDFDDTYEAGLVHLSAPVAPAACVLGAETSASIGAVLEAYAGGFEATAAVARASHPALYERGWHPTAVCGVVGSATASARLLDEDVDKCVSVALLRAGGLRSAFGSDGKSLQVGMAAAAGVEAARLVASGARAPAAVRRGFERAYGATWAEPDPRSPAIADNWIKAYPCCLATHSAIEGADRLRSEGGGVPLVVTVHPVALQAASYGAVSTGLEAKFSIPYLIGFTLLHGPPGAGDFSVVDSQALEVARSLTVETDATLAPMEARLQTEEGQATTVEAARGSPQRPLEREQLAAKVRALAGSALDGVLDDLDLPAKLLVDAARL